MEVDVPHLTYVGVGVAVIVTVFVIRGIVMPLWRFGSWLAPKLRRLGRFLDAWEGYTDPATGEHVPGVLERLTGVEETAATAASAAAAANGRLDHLSQQVSEVRDLAEQTRDQTQALAAEQTQIRAALEDQRSTGTDAPTTGPPPPDHTT